MSAGEPSKDCEPITLKGLQLCVSVVQQSGAAVIDLLLIFLAAVWYYLVWKCTATSTGFRLFP